MLFVYADATYENGTGFGHGYVPGKNTHGQLSYGDGYGETDSRGSGSGVLHSSASTWGYGHGVGDGFCSSRFTGHGIGCTGAGKIWSVAAKGAYDYGRGDSCGGGNGVASGTGSDVEHA